MGNRHESLCTDMIAEMGRKSRLPKRSGGEKTTLSKVTSSPRRKPSHYWERESFCNRPELKENEKG